MQIYNRADIVNFMKVDDKYIRMQGFTSGGKESNAKKYSRQYIDENFERESTTGYAPNIPYNFDRIKDNAVHEKIAKIHDDELIGETAEILTVNMLTKEARLRTYDVNPETDGDGTDAYTYAGGFRASGKMTKGIATVSADGLTATFTAEGEPEPDAQEAGEE